VAALSRLAATSGWSKKETCGGDETPTLVNVPIFCLLKEAGDAVHRLKLALEARTPLWVTMASTIESDRVALSKSVIRLVPRVADLSSMSEPETPWSKLPDLVLITSPQSVRYGWVPRGRVTPDGRLETFAQ